MTLPNTTSLTDFRERTAAHVKRLQRADRPTMLTRNGRACAVVMSPAMYESLAKAAEHAATIKALRESLATPGAISPASAAIARVRASVQRRAARKAG
jgi:prevent-host-death family protein